jgi:NADH dehydrogenase [ubiquinone] 1 alpha subcomplex assembly factor 1
LHPRNLGIEFGVVDAQQVVARLGVWLEKSVAAIFRKGGMVGFTINTIMGTKVSLALPSLFFGLLLMTSFVASGSEKMEELIITNFMADDADLGWYVQNDNVMGGRSKGDFEKTDGELIFAGSTNTNGGGFSSIRTRPFQLNLSKNQGIRLKVKGDGRRYTWQLQTNARWRGNKISYWADFKTVAGEWSVVDIPFSEFFPQFRGFKLDEPKLDSSQITEMGLYIYDKQDGPFELHLKSIRAYSEN